MEWTDEAIVLGARRQGESSLILSLLTCRHGRHRGLIRGAGRRPGGSHQPGARVQARWSARLEEHLGHLQLESLGGVAALIIEDPLRLACLEAATAIAETVLPERAPHGAAFTALGELLDRLAADDGYAAAELRFEVTLLAELGYGLDLGSCAVTGETADLAYVSPRSGRAVSRDAGARYADRLLILPRLLGGIGSGGNDAQDLLDGLALTGFFLERNMLNPAGTHLPPARDRYRDRLARLAAVGATEV
jgi:DNA repair protein RecO (recombination protein O)